MSELDDRRRDDRRADHVRLAEYTVPELRKALLSIALLVVALGLFLYMIHGVIVAVVAGIVAGAYLIPLDEWLRRRVRSGALTAIVTIVVFTVPLVTILVYSWIEITGAAQFLNENRAEVLAGLNRGIRRIPFLQGYDLAEPLDALVQAVANSSANIVDELREAVDVVLIGVALFLFTTFYVLTQHDQIIRYIAARIPGRYRSLTDPVSANIRAVIYGVLYGTFLTQLLKSAVVLAMNLIWNVPLALVLAIVSFFIGLLPIVGSWTVYTPIAIYLLLWRGDVVGGVLMLIVGFVGNTLFISMYLRPKIAAEKSHVLNFYWMFLALVTGVYTFGLMGIIIGPVLISVLKAVLDALTARQPAGGAAMAAAVEPAWTPKGP